MDEALQRAIEQGLPKDRLAEMSRRRFNVAPTNDVLAVLGGSRGIRAGVMTWGWHRHFLPKSRQLINARGEGAATKPTRAPALHARRCLIPATAFYEWRETDKQPFSFHRPDRAPFMIGALWERPTGSDDAAMVLLTTEANGVVLPVHHRMAHIVQEGDWQTWLDPDTPFEQVQAMIKPFPDAEMARHPVRRRISKAVEVGAEVAEQVAEGAD